MDRRRPGAAHRRGHGLPDPHRRRAGHRWLHRPGPPLILRHGARHQRHRTRQERRSGGLRCHPQPRAVAQLHRAPAGPGSGQPLRGARHGRGRRGRAHCQLQARGRRDRLRGPGPRPAPAGAHGLPGRQGRHGAAQGRSGHSRRQPAAGTEHPFGRGAVRHGRPFFRLHRQGAEARHRQGLGQGCLRRARPVPRPGRAALPAHADPGRAVRGQQQRAPAGRMGMQRAGRPGRDRHGHGAGFPAAGRGAGAVRPPLAAQPDGRCGSSLSAHQPAPAGGRGGVPA